MRWVSVVSCGLVLSVLAGSQLAYGGEAETRARLATARRVKQDQLAKRRGRDSALQWQSWRDQLAEYESLLQTYHTREFMGAAWESGGKVSMRSLEEEVAGRQGDLERCQRQDRDLGQTKGPQTALAEDALEAANKRLEKFKAYLDQKLIRKNAELAAEGITTYDGLAERVEEVKSKIAAFEQRDDQSKTLTREIRELDQQISDLDDRISQARNRGRAWDVKTKCSDPYWETVPPGGAPGSTDRSYFQGSCTEEGGACVLTLNIHGLLHDGKPECGDWAFTFTIPRPNELDKAEFEMIAKGECKVHARGGASLDEITREAGRLDVRTEGAISRQGEGILFLNMETRQATKVFKFRVGQSGGDEGVIRFFLWNYPVGVAYICCRE
jgi:hypothetical protein